MSNESSGNTNAVTRCVKRNQSVKMSTEKESKENSPSTNDANQRNKRPWTHRDKCKLLHALKRYGHTDIVNISRTLPNKSPTAIKAMISKYVTSSRKTKDLQSPINDWLQCGMFLQTDTLIPQALKFIELFEKHPLPNQAAGCDFRSAYNFLHRMVLGYRPIDAPPNTMRIVNYLLSKVIKEVWPAYKKEALAYFGYIGSKRKLNISKVYPEKLKEKLERPSHEFKTIKIPLILRIYDACHETSFFFDDTVNLKQNDALLRSTKLRLIKYPYMYNLPQSQNIDIIRDDKPGSNCYGANANEYINTMHQRQL